MVRRRPTSTLTDTRFPYTPLFRSRLVFAWRRQVVRAGKHVAGGGEHVAERGKRYGAAGFGHALATRSDAHDLVVAHNDALVSVSMAARSSAMKAAPRRRAASACRHTHAAAAPTRSAETTSEITTLK